MLPSQFKRAEQVIICGICYEYMETCVMTPCSHNYCSLCIRKYLHYKTECPVCFEETFEKDLRVNKALDEIVLFILEIKDNIPRYISAENIQFTPKSVQESNVIDRTPCTPKQINNAKALSLSQNKTTNDYVSVNEPRPASPFAQKVSEQILFSPSTSTQMKVHSIFTPKTKKTQKIVQKNSPVSKTVSCPVCKVNVSEININRHLDDCLKRQDGIPSVPKPQPKRKPIPKLVFSLMKDAELRKKLKEMKLSSQGDRKVLEGRLQRYITLYNAECDKSNPRPVADLLKQCEEEESLEKKAQKSSSIINKLHITRNTEQNLIEEAQKKYLEANKDSFASLIAKAKSTTVSKKPMARRSIFEQSPRKKQAICNDDFSDEARDFHQLELNDFVDEDSDSEVFCPLQTYSSEDPRRFLTLATSGDASKDSASPSEKKNTSPAKQPSFPSGEPSKRDTSGPLSRCASSRQNFNHDPSCRVVGNPGFSSRDNSPSSFSLHSPSSSPGKAGAAFDHALNSRYYNPRPRATPDEKIRLLSSPLDFLGADANDVDEKTFGTKAASSLQNSSEDVESLDSFQSDPKPDDLPERRSARDSSLRDSMLTEFLDELSNSDSNFSKLSYDTPSDRNPEFPDARCEVAISDRTKSEKENINSVAENAIARRAVRKRNREINVPNDEKSPKRERRARKATNQSSDGSRESSNTEASVSLYDRGKKYSRKIAPEENETSVALVTNYPDNSRRKSARTRNKNTNASEKNNGDAA